MNSKYNNFHFNYLKRLGLHIYEFRSESKFLSNWDGFFSNKWESEYCSIIDGNEDFWLMPFTGAELVLLPSVALKLIDNKNSFATIMYEKDGYATDEFLITDTVNSNWFITANILGAKIKKLKGTKYFKIKSYRDVMKLQDCGDESLELLFITAKPGFENDLRDLLKNEDIVDITELKNCVDLIIITANYFDSGDESITVLSFDKIHEKIIKIEDDINKAINGYEKSIVSAKSVASFFESVRSLRLE